MLKNDWLSLPEEIRIFVLEEVQAITHEIISKFELSEAQEVFVLDLEDDIILKKVDILEMANRLDMMSDAKNVDVRLLALDLAYKVFWPMQDYLEKVDRLILRLGGKVPRQKTLRVDNKSDDRIFFGTEENAVRNMLERYENFNSLRLTANKIKNKDGRIIAPTVENWIDDYVHFLGAGDHDSLKRARYLSKSENVLGVSEADREKLRYFFVSYDENTPVFFKLEKGILMVEEFKAKETVTVDKQEKTNLDQVLEDFHRSLIEIGSHMVAHNVIMSEAENNANKIRDVLWKAIGIGDKDKVVSCLKILIENKSFDAMLKEDSRFKNILKRFIGIKYGQSMERSLDDNMDKLIARLIFLEMTLVDKLKMSEEESCQVAYYLTNLIPASGQIIYLDKKDQKFKWREIQVLANKFVWVDKI